MEASLTQLAPSPSRVVRHQIDLLGAPATIMSLAVGLAGIQILVSSGWFAGPTRLMRLPVFDIFPFLVVIGALWPAIVWHGEGPSRRLYHWSLPVPRHQHDILRVVAGGVWLLLGLVSVELFQIAAALVNGYGDRLAGVSLGSWINYLTGPLTMYLVVSALAVATDHPLRWLLGVMFGMLAAGSLCNGVLACASSPMLPAIRHFFGLTDVIAPFIEVEVFRRTSMEPGFGAVVKIVIGLFAGAGAVYGAARWRAR